MKRIIAVLMAAVLMLGLFAGCSNEEPQVSDDSEVVALKIGNTEFSVKDINYMYITTFNSMYSNLYYTYGENLGAIIDIAKPLEEQMFDDTYSWDAYILETCINTLTNYTGIYEKAIAEGFELSDDQKEDLASLESEFAKAAEEAGMTVDEYLALMYGETVDFQTIYDMTEFQYIVGSFAQEFEKSLEVSEEDIMAYYEENKNTIDTVSFRFFTSYYSDEEGALTEEEAKAQAEAIAMASTSEEFTGLCYEYASEEMKSYYENPDYTLFPGATPETIGIDALTSWLYEDGRTQGETFIYHDADYKCYFSVMFEERISADYNFVDVRHILIMPEKDENDVATEEAWAAAEKEAQEIYDEYLAGDKSEQSFKILAGEHSQDGNASNGGIYEDVYKGQMVAPFENWCFDEARKPGDTDIVKTSFGYHIMYFIGESENNLVSLVEPVLAEQKLGEWVGAASEGLEVERLDAIAEAGKMIDDIVAAAEEQAAKEEETGNVTNEEVVSDEDESSEG